MKTFGLLLAITGLLFGSLLAGCDNLNQYDQVMVFVDGSQIYAGKCHMASVHRPGGSGR